MRSGGEGESIEVVAMAVSKMRREVVMMRKICWKDMSPSSISFCVDIYIYWILYESIDIFPSCLQFSINKIKFWL